MPYPRVNCSKTIPFTAAHTYIAHIWQYPPPLGRTANNCLNIYAGLSGDSCCRCCPGLQKFSNVSRVRFLHDASGSYIAIKLDPGRFVAKTFDQLARSWAQTVTSKLNWSGEKRPRRNRKYFLGLISMLYRNTKSVNKPRRWSREFNNKYTTVFRHNCATNVNMVEKKKKKNSQALWQFEQFIRGDEEMLNSTRVRNAAKVFSFINGACA